MSSLWAVLSAFQRDPIGEYRLHDQRIRHSTGVPSPLGRFGNSTSANLHNGRRMSATRPTIVHSAGVSKTPWDLFPELSLNFVEVFRCPLDPYKQKMGSYGHLEPCGFSKKMQSNSSIALLFFRLVNAAFRA